MAIYQIGDGNPDGVTIGGSASEKVSLYGVTPVVQAATIAAVTTTAATATSAWGFATQAQADAIVSNVNSIRLALVNVGIMASV